MRRPLRQRYDPSSVGVTRSPPLLYPTGKGDSAYLYGSFSSPYLRCPLKWMAECDVPIVLTSLQKKDGSLMGQDRGCRPGDPISLIPDDEYVILSPLQCGVLNYRPRTKPLNSRALGGPYSPIKLSPFFCIEVSTIGT
ncbi:hypothetical protein AVEN_212634-1 [Araneus ventricosus]|uniref:Uncharacterized protein n=1 Tax=Araneus ventricosus TaxID=182803 RepID=A0A4Y2W8Y1_ARAVE|nr:hypothetical protein AVEN_212634-1 [Araneus ventricosus]